MSWLKNKVRNWLNSDNMMSAPEKAYSGQVTPAREANPVLQLIKAVNGTVVQCQFYRPSTKLHGDSSWETDYYVLKDGESVAEAVAVLLVKHKLDQR